MTTSSRSRNRLSTGAEARPVQARIASEHAQLALVIQSRDAVRSTLDKIELDIAAAERRLVELQAAHAETTRSLEDIEVQHGILLDAIAKQPKWFHAIRELSYEVLGKIFKQCVFDLGHLEFNDFQSTAYRKHLERESMRTSQQLPFVLAAVCQRWRRAALSAAAIWTYLDIDLDPGFVDELPRMTTRLALTLGRARSSSLNVTIRRSGGDSNEYANILNTLGPALPWIRFLNIQVESFNESPDSLNAILGCSLQCCS